MSKRNRAANARVDGAKAVAALGPPACDRVDSCAKPTRAAHLRERARRPSQPPSRFLRSATSFSSCSMRVSISQIQGSLKTPAGSPAKSPLHLVAKARVRRERLGVRPDSAATPQSRIEHAERDQFGCLASSLGVERRVLPPPHLADCVGVQGGRRDAGRDAAVAPNKCWSMRLARLLPPRRTRPIGEAASPHTSRKPRAASAVDSSA